MLLKDRSISQSLTAAVSAIGKTSADKYFSERRALEEKLAAKQMKMPNQPAPKADAPAHSGAADMAKKNMKSVKEAAEGSHPRNEKEKQLAKLHGDPNKITHGDVLKGRGVRKEAFADMMRDVKARHDKDEKEKGTGKFDKKVTSTGTVYTRKSSTFDDGGKDTDMKKAEKKMKQEEAVTEAEQMSRAAKGHEKYGKEGMQALAKAGKEGKALDPVRKKYDKYAESMDTPGNSTHQCAIHVKSEQFGEGKTLSSQHAEPAADGSIAWYDVMFAEGIKRVETKDIEITLSENHMNHKKKKKM